MDTSALLTDHVSEGYAGCCVAESPGAVLVSSASGSGHDDFSLGNTSLHLGSRKSVSWIYRSTGCVDSFVCSVGLNCKACCIYGLRPAQLHK